MQTLLEVIRELAFKSPVTGKVCPCQPAVLNRMCELNNCPYAACFLQGEYLDALGAMFPAIAQLWSNMADVFEEQVRSLLSTGVGGSTHAASSANGDLSCDAVEADPVLLFDHFCVTTAVLRYILVKGYQNMVLISADYRTHFISTSGFVQRYFRIYTEFHGMYGNLCRRVSVFGGRNPADDDIGVLDEDDLEDELYYFDGCSQIARQHGQQHDHGRLLAAVFGLRQSLREMACVPMALRKACYSEMAPLWLTDSLQVSYDLLNQFARDASVGPAFEHKSVVISSILFLAGTCIVPVAKPNAGYKGRFPYESIQATADSVREQFLTKDRLLGLVDLSVRYLLVWTKRDLLEWANDPEQFYFCQTGSSVNVGPVLL
jgi:hypothetical protein